MIQSGGGGRRRAQAQAVAVRALARGNAMPGVAVDLHLDVPGGDVVLCGDEGVRGLVRAVPPKGDSPRLDPAHVLCCGSA